jgi:hypothetical protein
MKRLFAVIALSLCMAAPSFATDTVGHSVKAAGKDSGKGRGSHRERRHKSRWVGCEISLVTTTENRNSNFIGRCHYEDSQEFCRTRLAYRFCSVL